MGRSSELLLLLLQDVSRRNFWRAALRHNSATGRVLQRPPNFAQKCGSTRIFAKYNTAPCPAKKMARFGQPSLF
jgi:hypothetical protein